MSNLIDELKEDFIENMTNYNECNEEEVNRLWNEYGEEYLNDIFQDMSERIVEIANKEQE